MAQAQRHRRALLIRQPHEQAGNVDRRAAFGRGMIILGQLARPLVGAPALAPLAVKKLAPANPGQPTPIAAVAAKVGTALPGTQKSLLRQFITIGWPRHATEKRTQPTLMAEDQLVKGAAVARRRQSREGDIIIPAQRPAPRPARVFAGGG